MEKSPDAFRTISEVAELLETPAHVLRFWESRFPQIRPVKRAGGRRYYRPADVALLTGIKRLLHDDGMTIRGVQKILREQGVKHVSGVTDDASADDDAALEAALAAFGHDGQQHTPMPPAEAETAQIIALQSALNPSGRVAAEPTLPQSQDAMGAVDEHADDEDMAEMADEDVSAILQSAEATSSGHDGTDVSDEDFALLPDDVAAPSEDALSTALHSTTEPQSTQETAEDPPTDLFAYRPANGRQPSPEDPVDEAPMTLWAEADEPEMPQQAEVASFPPAPVGEGESDPQSLPADQAGSGDDTVPGPTPLASPAVTEPPVAPSPATAEPDAPTTPMATRLRAINPDTLSDEDRETLGHLRQAAIDLRLRMMAPARTLP